jgi:two-component system response regulator AtoC
MEKKIVFVVDDEENIRRLLHHLLATKWGYEVRMFTTGEECLAAMDESPDLVILDIMLPGISGADTLVALKKRDPDLPVIILSSQGSIEVAIETVKLGAMDYFSKTIDYPKFESAVRNAMQMRELAHEVVRLRESVQSTGRFDNIITSDGAMADVMKMIHKASQSDIAVQIQGESGTGKELVARAIHFNGKRREGPFIAVNCAAIPKDLIESEMFGHERGSFTGAHQKKLGKFEQAHGGTIFLDEIGELDLNLQSKLLRVLQQKQLERVGGDEVIDVDLRIVSATNRDLLQASRRGEFREDLYYRLASFPIHLPPLRKRRGDILLLADHFLRRFSADQDRPARSFSRAALKLLQEYPWPGNVRELESAIERAVILADGDTIAVEDLPVTVQTYSPGDQVFNSADTRFTNNDPVIPLEQLKEQAVRHALEVTEGNIVEAARKLGISRSTLYEMIRKYGAGKD